ncbi:MAG: rhomboid family intramembrane serine protease [Acidobacteria bacterium]|nr:rhomboid family intramembrane serine protease [Acidobacteriota bacterium]
MLRRQKTGSVLCPSCGKLVGVQDKECWNCGRRNPGMWGFSSLLRKLGNDFGFVSIVTWGCVALYVATLLTDPHGIRMSGMSILEPSSRSVVLFGASGAIPVFGYGRWWTVLSATWLHGNLLHIVFNLLWIRQLAPAVSELYGASRTVIIYTAASIAGFLLSSTAGLVFGASPIFFLRGAALTLGASASIFGLLGALVLYGRRGGSSHIGGQAKSYALILFIFGFVMPNIDNYAHLGGFLGGYAAARWLDPLRPERVDHMIAAIICLAATALSIIASVYTIRFA